MRETACVVLRADDMTAPSLYVLIALALVLAAEVVLGVATSVTP